jgi:hypothetical protein
MNIHYQDEFLESTPMCDTPSAREVARERVADYRTRHSTHSSTGSLIGETYEHQIFSPRVWGLNVIRPQEKLATILYPKK